MNTTLPPTRDLPPHRRARIRAVLEDEVTRGRRRVRYAPLIAAGLATAAVIALVAVVPWQQQHHSDAAASGSRTYSPTTILPPPAAAVKPVIPDLSPERIAQVEEGCRESATIPGKAVLHQYLTDAAGTFALLYTEDTMLGCVVDDPAMPFNTSYAWKTEVEWLPGEFSADQVGSTSGGDIGKAEYRGRAGYDMAVGRVSARVAKVTFTKDERTVEATIANGTFVARILRPSDYMMTEGLGDVRAYDAQGSLLGTSESTSTQDRCYVTPDHERVLGPADSDPTTCLPAVSWRL